MMAVSERIDLVRQPALDELASAVNAIRQRFPVVPMMCIPWMHLKHPLHPRQEELIESKTATTVLADTEEQRSVVMPLIKRMAGSNSLLVRSILCIANAVRLSFKLVRLKWHLRREIRDLRTTKFDIIGKTWCFGSERTTDRDFYYGDLQHRLALRGTRMLLLCGDANNTDWRTFAGAQTSTHEPFRLAELCLAPNLSPIAIGLSQITTAIKLRRNASIERNPITKRVAAVASLDILSTPVTQSSLLFYIAKESVKRWNPTAFMTLYEGHGWEKSAWWGAKAESNRCQTVGYQHTALFAEMLSVLRPFVDARERSVPDVVLALGSRPAELLEAGHRAYQVKTVPFGTFRHDGFTEAKKPADPMRRTVLVIPEGIVSEMELMFKFASRCAEVMPNYRFILRAHPKWQRTKALREISASIQNVPNIVWSERTIDRDFDSASVMLYRGSSSALYGTLNGLLPVYLNVPDTRVSDPLFELSMWHQMCESPDDLRHKLSRFEDEPPEARSSEWQSAVEYVRNYIPPVTDRSIRDFLCAVGIDGGTQRCTA